MESTNLKNFVVLDIETTGLQPGIEYSKSKPIQISALRVMHGRVLSTLSFYVNPGSHIPAFITDLTGITDRTVKDGKSVEDAMSLLYNFLEYDDVILGYNIEKFDIPFLNIFMDYYLGMRLENQTCDVLKLARKLLKDHSLANMKQVTVAEYFGIDASKAHNALEDCKVCLEIYNRLCILDNM